MDSNVERKLHANKFHKDGEMFLLEIKTHYKISGWVKQALTHMECHKVAF